MLVGTVSSGNATSYGIAKENDVVLICAAPAAANMTSPASTSLYLPRHAELGL
ncbi:MAG: hypothetical protein H6649_08085 [Caldilineae bacterium]|nr:hypothetical protein [Caldilineae bacterium]